MSDDRMDRAERIRNMREGNRGTDDDEAESETDAGPPASESDPRSSDHSETTASSESEPAGDGSTGFSSLSTEGSSATSGETERSGGQADDTAGATATAEAVEAAEAAAAAVESDGTPTASTGDTSSEAQAAAQRAAASAADVMDTAAETDAAAETGTPTDTQAAGIDESAVPEGATGAGTVPGDVTGVELPDQQLLEEAMATSSVKSTEGGARAAMEGDSSQTEEVVRVLEFSLGEEYYCLDIEYVEEIVKRNAVTRVPNTPEFVDGVVDLRGQITTILEPKEMMDIDSEGDQNLIIVFDPEQFEEQGAVGWVVDEVRQVVPVPESEINHPPVDAEYINGVVDRDEYDQFVIWIEPEDALAQATANEDE